MNMKAALTFACMNLKKLAKMMDRMDFDSQILSNLKRFFARFFKTQKFIQKKKSCVGTECSDTTLSTV